MQVLNKLTKDLSFGGLQNIIPTQLFSSLSKTGVEEVNVVLDRWMGLKHLE